VVDNGPYQIPEFRPERVLAMEIGYKGLILNKHLLVDAYVFRNKYSGFLANQTLAQNPNTEEEVRYQTMVSTDFPVVAYGWVVGTEYRFGRSFLMKGNIAFNQLGKIEDPPPGFTTQYNTPRYKFNLGFGNRQLTQKIGFNVNWRWQEGFLWQSTFGTARMPSYSILDAHVSLHLPNMRSRIKIGGSNILNQYYTTSFGSAQIGALYYITWTYNDGFN
jgi:outer membrane receptor protein involved in Fe transport